MLIKLYDPEEDKIIKEYTLKSGISGGEETDDLLSELGDVLDLETDEAELSNLKIYDDNYKNLRKKIGLVLNIPHVYLHLLSYEIRISDIKHQIDIRDYKDGYNVRGIKLDPEMRLHDNFSDIRVIDYDYSTVKENVFWVADIRNILKNKNIRVDDKQILNQLFYGFLVKYWPWISLSELIQIINGQDIVDEESIKNNLKQFQAESEVYKKIENLEKWEEDAIVTEVIYRVIPTIYTNNKGISTNLRNAFNHISGYQLYLFYKDFSGCRFFRATKRHISEDEPKTKILSKSCLQIFKNKHVFTLFETGTYEIECIWNESGVIFDNLIENVSIVVNEIIEKINKFSYYIFPNGGKLELLNADNSKIKSLTCYIIYRHPMDQEAFKGIRSKLKKLNDGGILHTKSFMMNQINLTYQNINVSDYDSVDFIEPHGWNSYEFFEQPDNKTRLELLTTRTIKLFHRVSDIKIDFFRFSKKDFENAKKFIFSVLQGLESTKIVQKTEGLKSLMQLDPRLFNLKNNPKYNGPVYSVLCQGLKTPVMYSKSEYKILDKKIAEKTVKYHNITRNEPAYYHCPNQKYPILSFLNNKHPEKFCIPCCQKGIDDSEIYKTCLKTTLYPEHNNNNSKHMLSYGKVLSPGRYGLIPIQLEELFGEIETNFFLVGVEQSVSAIPDAGLFYSLAFILEMEPEEYCRKLIEAINLMKDKTFVANKIKADKELANSLILAFIEKAPFSQLRYIPWKKLLFELTRYIFSVNVFEFVEQGDDFDLRYESYKDMAICIILTHENQTVPVISQDSETLFTDDSRVFKTLYSVVQENYSNWDLSYIINNPIKWKIKYKLINIRDFCYAVILEKDNEEAYVPIYESVHFNDEYKSATNALWLGGKRENVLEIIKCYKKTIENDIAVDNKIIGVKCMGLIWYHNEIPLLKTQNRENIIFLRHHPHEINKCITNVEVPVLSERAETFAKNTRYFNNIFQLWLHEFQQRVTKTNTEKRSALLKIIKKSDMKNNSDINKIRQFLKEEMSEQDRKVINLIIYNSEDFETLKTRIDKSKFLFDSKLEDLKNKDTKTIKNFIKEIMEDCTVHGIGEIRNDFVSCAKDHNQPQCEGSKIKIPKFLLNGFIDLLVENLENPHFIIPSHNYIDPFEFNCNNDEIINFIN